jgi:predicted acylesterase/phospholipase RssA
VFDRWRELSSSGGRGRTVVVDVIAGTSAGGLNGALLATAIANKGTLDPGDAEDPDGAGDAEGPNDTEDARDPNDTEDAEGPNDTGDAEDPNDTGDARGPNDTGDAGGGEPQHEPQHVPGPWLRERWAELGALTPGQLLPDASLAEQPPSVLNGGYFLEQLHTVLSRLTSERTGDPVTLFLTASGLGEHGITARDAADQSFSVADHRFLYRFSCGPHTTYRPGSGYERAQVSDFAGVDALAEASRASASFPVAFAPIQETDRLDRRPPRVRPPVGHPRSAPSWLMDGGVLDNAPFGPVLDEIARRPVRAPTGEYVNSSRYVLYVVPSSGGAGPAPATGGPQPGWKDALAAAMRYPSEADLRGDVEELEQLLFDADASWSDTQRLQETCIVDPAEAERVRRAAAELQPAYTRGRAAGGVWEAITIASPTGTTVLDTEAPITADDVAKILAAQPLWLPPPAAEPVQPLLGEPGARTWPWGTGPADRVLRLMLRSHRTPTVPAATAAALVTIDRAIDRVVAVRDALNAELATTALPTPADRAALTTAVNEIFTRLDIPRALGAAIGPVAGVLPDELRTALAVEIVSRCTSARTPLQRSAPFRFLRLGPDVELPVLAGTSSQAPAKELGDRILYGTQVSHFGAFGAVSWRRWDWLLGRLHGAAHLGRLLGADDDWIRDTQRAIVAAEGSSMHDFVAGVSTMAGDFPSGPAGRRTALITMRDQLNETADGGSTLRGLGDRLVDVSPGLSAAVGQWAKAVLQRDWDSRGTLYRWARWFTEPARLVLWERLVRGAPQTRTPRPQPLASWLVAVLTLVAAGLIAGAVALSGAAAVVLAVLGGAVLAVAAILLAVRLWVDRRRRQLEARVGRAVPALPEPASTGPRSQR